MLRKTLALCGLMALGLAAATPAGSASDVEWIAGKGVFHTTKPVDAGAELRIRIQKPGKDMLQLLRWEGKKKKQKARVLRSWDRSELRREQVLHYTLPERMRLALRVRGDKHRPPKGSSGHESFRRLRFGGGWVIDVKVVSDTF